MSVRTVDYMEVIEQIMNGEKARFEDVGWDEYEHLLTQVSHRPGLRVSYDQGRLEVMSPLPEPKNSSPSSAIWFAPCPMRRTSQSRCAAPRLTGSAESRKPLSPMRAST